MNTCMYNKKVFSYWIIIVQTGTIVLLTVKFNVNKKVSNFSGHMYALSPALNTCISFQCKWSFSRKVDLDKKNRGGWTPLMYACYIGHDNIVNLLLDASVSVNVQNNKGQTPLMLAASCGNESVAYFIYQVISIIELH